MLIRKYFRVFLTFESFSLHFHEKFNYVTPTKHTPKRLNLQLIFVNKIQNTSKKKRRKSLIIIIYLYFHLIVLFFFHFYSSFHQSSFLLKHCSKNNHLNFISSCCLFLFKSIFYLFYVALGLS